jgi:hypothetical protein
VVSVGSRDLRKQEHVPGPVSRFSADKMLLSSSTAVGFGNPRWF